MINTTYNGLYRLAGDILLVTFTDMVNAETTRRRIKDNNSKIKKRAINVLNSCKAFFDSKLGKTAMNMYGLECIHYDDLLKILMKNPVHYMNHIGRQISGPID